MAVRNLPKFPAGKGRSEICPLSIDAEERKERTTVAKKPTPPSD